MRFVQGTTVFLQNSPTVSNYLIPLHFLDITLNFLEVSPIHRQLLLLTHGSPLQGWIALDFEELPQTCRFLQSKVDKTRHPSYSIKEISSVVTSICYFTPKPEAENA